MADKIEVVANFVEDIRAELVSQLNGLGVGVPNPDNVVEVCVAFLNVSKKAILPRVRRVHRSKELSERLPQLRVQLRAGVQRIEALSLAGAGLAAAGTLSRRVAKPLCFDGLLEDWGIHHLHLVPGRGKELLFAWVDLDDMYLLDVRDHESFVDTSLLEIVLRNWPGLMEPLHLKDVIDADSFDGEARAGIRRINGLMLTVLSDKKVYFPRGRDGENNVRMKAVDILNFAQGVERHFRGRAPQAAREAGVSRLLLRYDPFGKKVIETTTGRVWPVHEQKPSGKVEKSDAP